MLSLIFLLFIAVIIFVVVYRIRVGKANATDGVIADWNGVRMTRTELIEGYKKNARRHPLAGLTARVENSGSVTSTVKGTIYGGSGHIGTDSQDDRQVHLIVEGPNTAITKSRSVRYDGNADRSARQFATALNMASRRQLAEHNGHQQASPPPSVPAGWYPDPNNALSQRYWDGTRWTETTAPPVA
ncbi:DUF2510 domain-containing protein [Mycobacterium kyorinense]|uniref:DUF2510 domain-containing protein n=1 Tax=Mycobacterium kyorinense TaxID=487514 RepID=A0A1X1Y457_9MYCO|nr:DUF2510 domain-containing protein [Mycobacterium kyorinense]ORW05816.1 hypothetical protein AWC14_01895 [Mycobacterium kyorinense]